MRLQPQITHPILNLEVFRLFFKTKVSIVQPFVLSVRCAHCYNTGIHMLCLSFTDWEKKTLFTQIAVNSILSLNTETATVSKMQLFRG